MLAGGLALLRSTIPWDEVARPLPVAMAAAILAQLITLARARGGSEVAARELMKLAMLVFAFVLLFKMILNTRVSHYGFVLAMPATLLFTVAVVDWIPRRIIRKGGGGEIFGAMALAAVLVTVVGHVRIMSVFSRAKTYTVASGRDAFSADVGGLAVNLALEAIADHVGPQQTLAVLPEGVMLNYLARRVNPTPHHAFMPPSLIAFGEEEILQTFKDDPPDFIMLVHKDTSEFGFRFFGRDYGLQIAAWISAGYEPLQLIGAPPLQDDRFGILLLRRKPS